MRCRAFVMMSFFVVFAAGRANCEMMEKTALQSSGELQILQEFTPSFGTYRYDVFWKSMYIGEAEISVSADGDFYRIEVHAATSGTLDALYRIRYRGEVEMTPFPLRPFKVSVEEKSGSKEKNTRITFPEENRAEAVIVETVKGKNEKIKEVSAESENLLLDPFSVVFLIRHLDWHVGMTEVFEVFTGRKKYDFYLFCEKLVTVEMDGERREAFVIRPAYRDLKKGGEWQSTFTVLLSTDESRDILRITGVARIGKVKVKLREKAMFPH